MATDPAPSPARPAPPLEYFVDGMDCASCVQKVEGMVDRLPGTQDVKTSFTRQTLQLRLDETLTPRETLERSLRALGYEPSLRPQTPTRRGARFTRLDDAQREALLSPDFVPDDTDRHAHDHAAHLHAAPAAAAATDHTTHVHEPAVAAPWYATRAGRLVLVSGALLALAWALGFVAPAAGQVTFSAATLVAVWPFARKALASARLGDPFSINMLVTLAALGAVLIGNAAEGAVVVFLFAVGELLEGVAAGRARAGIQALAALAPRTALLLTGGAVREVPADTLLVGQEVQVNPGARVPADGVITAGTSSLDDSPVTGESVPVVKGTGDAVYAGSINTDGTLTVRVEREASDNTIARIIHLVEEAEGSKAPTARFIDRFSRWYTPGVVLVSALVAVVPPLLGGPWHEWLYKGLALLLIGCPCALVLSVPAAITSAISAGTRRGLLVKGGAALETIGAVHTVAFDKTGTLTAGRPRVTDVRPGSSPADDVLRLAAAVESSSSHPLARAITAAAQERAFPAAQVTGARAIAGQGVSATVDGRTLTVCSPAALPPTVTLGDALSTATDIDERDGKTAVVLHDGVQVLGTIAIRDEARPDARATLAALRELGVHAVMLTGDNARTGQAIAGTLGLDVQANLKPEDKLRAIDALRASGPVAMVGDGINDAPALARADVGIAMGGGTDVALETADAALLRERVSGVADLIRLSRATMGNIRQNIAFALGLKAIFLVTTLLGYTNLWMAILADTGATALVTANALRLLAWKGQDQS